MDKAIDQRPNKQLLLQSIYIEARSGDKKYGNITFFGL